VNSPRRAKRIPFEFVLDAIFELEPRTRPMFGCTAVYIGEKIVFVLREKGGSPDDGIWIATTVAHHESLRREFPALRSIAVLGKGVTGWQVLPADAPDFEESALRLAGFIAARDPRIGKVPNQRSRRKTPL
jgi:hypothetical protein